MNNENNEVNINPNSNSTDPNPITPQPSGNLNVMPESQQSDAASTVVGAQQPSPMVGQTPSPIVQDNSATSPINQPTTLSQPLSDESTEYNSNPFKVAGKGLGAALSVNPVPTLLIAIIPYVLFFVFPITTIITSTLGIIAGIISILVLLVITILVLIRTVSGSIVIVIESIRGNEITTKDAFGSLSKKHLTTFVFASILAGIFTFIGFLFLVIPGIIILARLSLVPILVYAEEIGVMDSIKRSFKLTKGHTFEMLGAITAQSIISGNGLLSFTGAYSGTTKRYFELVEAEKNGVIKPSKVHWLNFALPLVGFILIGLWMLVLIISSSSSNKNNDYLSGQDDFGGFSSFNSLQSSSANDTIRKNEINSLYQKLEEYYNENGSYPGATINSSNVTTIFPGIDSSVIVDSNGNEIIVAFDDSTYAVNYPTPDKNNQYSIVLYGEGCDGSGNSNCTGYELAGYLENEPTYYKFSLN